MYHDEFARKSAKPTPRGEDHLPSCLTLEVGGGLSLGLAASLDQSISMLLLYLGGLLPLVTCSISIAASRATEMLASLARPLQAPRPSIVPAHHMPASARSMAGHRLASQRARVSH